MLHEAKRFLFFSLIDNKSSYDSAWYIVSESWMDIQGINELIKVVSIFKM